MPGVNDRRPRPTIPFDSQKLARESQEEGEVDDLVDLALSERPTPHPRVVAQPPRVASGTTPPQGVGVRPAPATDDPAAELRSRTATIHDPLTTSVLAEVARRTGDDAREEPAAETDHADADRTPIDRPPRGR